MQRLKIQEVLDKTKMPKSENLNGAEIHSIFYNIGYSAFIVFMDSSVLATSIVKEAEEDDNSLTLHTLNSIYVIKKEQE